MSEIPIIECHTHVYRTPEIGRQAMRGLGADVKWDATIPELLQCMNDSGITHSVILTVTPTQEMREKAMGELPENSSEEARNEALQKINAALTGRMRRNNIWGCEVGNEHPNLLPFPNIDPFLMTGDEWASELDDLRKAGAKGIKLLPSQHHFRGNDKRLWPVYRFAAEHKMPILSQSGAHGSGEAWGHPKWFAEALRDFPGINLILAHFGTGAEDDVIKLCNEFPNVYPDLSSRWAGTRGGKGWNLNEMAAAIRQVGADRVVFATNWPLSDQPEDVKAARQLPLREDELRKVLHDNAERILGL